MKNSGIEWIGEIPEDWEVKPLTSLFSFGKGLPITKEDLKENGIPVLSYGQIHSKTNTGTNIQNDLLRYVDESYLVSNPQSLVQRGDFIFADTSEDLDGCGNCAYVNFDSKLFAGYHTVILKSKDCSNNQYLAYLFKTDEWRKQIRAGLVEVKLYSISRKVLKKSSVILPPKSTQRRITSYLDKKCSKIEETIQNQQQVIEKLKVYKQSLITEAVTGKKYHENCHTDSILLTQNSNEDMKTEIPLGISNPCGSIEFKYCNLSFIADFKNGLNYNASDFGTEVKFLGVGDFQNYLVLNDESMFSNIITDTEIEDDYYLKNGDIIFVRSNGSKELVGRAIMVDNIDFKVTYSGFCIRLRNKESQKINSKFLLYFFRSDYFRSELQRLSQGSNISNINQDLLSHIKIPLVDIRFQESVVDFLDKKCTAIDTVIEQKQSLIEKLTEYKKSLIYECVTGKKEI